MPVCLQDQQFPHFVREFIRDLYPAGDVPVWVREAMEVGTRGLLQSFDYCSKTAEFQGCIMVNFFLYRL